MNDMKIHDALTPSSYTPEYIKECIKFVQSGDITIGMYDVETTLKTKMLNLQPFKVEPGIGEHYTYLLFSFVGSEFVKQHPLTCSEEIIDVLNLMLEHRGN